MRPRINNNWNISRIELDSWLLENKIYGLTVDTSNDKIYIYKSVIMYRNNKKDPEILYIEVSRKSKMVLKAYTDNYTFLSLDDLKTRLKYE